MVVCKFPFVRFLLAFTLGLLMGMYEVIVSPKVAWLAFTFCLGLYMILLVVPRRHLGFKQSHADLGMLGLAAVCMAGTVRFLAKKEVSDARHILHHTEGIAAYQGVVIATKSHGEYVQLTLSLSHVQKKEAWHKAVGKAKVWLPTGSYRYGDMLQIEGRLPRIGRPRNPYTYDMQRWSAQQGVYHQAFISQKQVIRCGYAPPSRLMVAAYCVRGFLSERLTAYVHNPKVRSMVLALVLGMRDDMDKGVSDAFATAGILHILAVSGLHVGMLYAILLFLLGLLGISGYRRRGWQAMVVVTCLWGYAFVTALSPSVVRAVMMVSLSTVARLLGRRYNFWNGLATTALAGLFYEPGWLTDLGFQLSYLAVMGIALFYQRLMEVVRIQHWLWRRGWQVIALSVSVQMTTLPLSLYHFHYMPTYVWLGNFVAVPLASLLLGLGLLACLLGSMPWAGAGVGACLAYLASGLYHYAAWLSAVA